MIFLSQRRAPPEDPSNSRTRSICSRAKQTIAASFRRGLSSPDAPVRGWDELPRLRRAEQHPDTTSSRLRRFAPTRPSTDIERLISQLFPSASSEALPVSSASIEAVARATALLLRVDHNSPSRQPPPWPLRKPTARRAGEGQEASGPIEDRARSAVAKIDSFFRLMQQQWRRICTSAPATPKLASTVISAAVRQARQ